MSSSECTGIIKTSFLYELLRALELAIERGLSGAIPFLDLVAPIANVISRVTDGDETANLIQDFAAITILAGSSEMACAMYNTLFGEERYYQADNVFEAIAEFGSLSNVWLRALLRTAVDSASRHNIANRSDMAAFNCDFDART
jgi:hypothetical protein